MKLKPHPGVQRHSAVRRPPSSLPGPSVAVLLAAIALSVVACGREVTVAPAEVDPSQRSACAALEEQLPDTLSGGQRLTTAPDSTTTAAWGAPAIVWRCGVAAPVALSPTSQLASISGQDWFPETLTNGTRFTSVENTPRQELTIPIGYPNPAGIVAELTAEE